MIELIEFLITTGVLISNILFVLFVLVFFLSKNIKEKSKIFIENNVVYFIFTISLLSVIGSIIYSDIIGYPPCELCWYQRIFIYPQAILSFLAILKKEKNIVFYLLPLSILGFLISLYQSYVQWGGESLLPCTKEGVECSKLYVYEYGYITIPFMALSAFVYMIFFSLFYKNQNKIN